LFANNLWYANRAFVRNAYCNSLAALDGLLLTYWHANCVRNFLADCFAGPAAYCVVASTSFRNHSALTYTDVLGSLLANPIAGLVANCLSAAFRNHLAGGIANGLLMAFRNHLASGVADRLLTAFWHHLAGSISYSLAAWLADVGANSIVTCLAMAFWDHLAGGVTNGLLSAFRNHLANCVRNRFGYAAFLVTNAVDFLSFAGWNPNLLANSLWWALNAFNGAATWYIDAFAL
jgi:AcrR family transcriptional regulator